MQISFQKNGGEVVYVQADPLRLKQIGLNLLSNAIKYNKDGGLVEIKIEEKGDGNVRLSFKDTGVGIPEEKLGRLFILFERLEDDPDATEGTGIGLTITRQFVELMGGTIGVESQYGAGSCFYIELPRT